MAGGRRPRVKSVAAGVALMLAIAGCSFGAPATASAAFDEWGSNSPSGGVAFVRRADGSSQSLATGNDAASGQPLDPQDRVRVGSISKVFIAAMVMQLVDENSVDLDADVSDYVENLSVGDDVTVRQLLAHRSGIPSYTDTEGFLAYSTGEPDQSPTPSDLLDLVAGRSNFDPGARYQYSNSNYIVLGMLIEAVDESTLNEALAARITTPLALTRTGFDDGELTDVATGFSDSPARASVSSSYRSVAQSAWAAGGLVTTVEDLAIFLDALFFDDLISAESLDQMVAGLEDGAEYGLGLRTGDDFGVGHGGSIQQFNSLAEIDPETGEMIIVVVNNDTLDAAVPSRAIWRAIRAS